MRLFQIFFTVICLSPLFSPAQEFNIPVLLGPQINSPSEEISPLLSPDGNTLYFVRAYDQKNIGGQIGGMDIWTAKRNNQQQWEQATNQIQWNNKGNNAVIGIGKDGNVLYLLNAYKNKNGIVFSKLLSGKWTDPQLIPIQGIDKTDFVGFYMSPSFDVLLISKNGRDSFGQEDLYITIKDSFDRWSEPVNLGPTINTSGFEISPFLSEDKKRLYFSSNGREGYGDADIFVSERLYDSWVVWSRPRNLGPGINSEKFDAYFSIYQDSVCFFSSNRNSVLADIYKTTVKSQQTDILKDSINRIIQDAQKLLSDLKESPDLLTKSLVVNIPVNATSLDRQLNTFLRSFELSKVKHIEVACYAGTETEQIKQNQTDVISYFTQRGIARENLVLSSAVKKQKDNDYMEIKIYVQE